MFRSTFLTVSASLLVLGTITSTEVLASDDRSCIQRAQWVEPDSKTILNTQDLIKKAASDQVVLLGEQHENAKHHQWQYQTLAQLFAYNPNMVIGFEMFPRRVQPVLNSWVRGELTREQFLKDSEWDRVWRYDPDLYMPLFEFARMNRLPMLALNVERDLISEVGDKGWDNVDEEIKEGVTRPLAPSDDYLDVLKEIYSYHPTNASEDMTEADKEKSFNNFVEAQLTWDGAMAQKLAKTFKQGGEPLMVGIMGAGHLRFGHGVPHQLGKDGLSSTVLLPWTLDWPCSEMEGKIADAVFGVEAVPPAVERFRPVLGVRIGPIEDEDGVLVEQTVEESVAEDAGLLKGDIIKRAAGIELATPQDLIEVVRRQAPGTWLPIEIIRDGKDMEVIAKFPSYPLG